MSKRFILKRMMAGGMFIFLLGGIWVNEVKADNAIKQSPMVVNKYVDEKISIASTTKEWRYKTVNGKRYMRLYDLLNEKWLTDWIPCN